MPSKSTGIAYVLWFFFGGVGAHKFYLGRPGVGALYIGMFVLFWAGVLTLLGDAVLAVQQGAYPYGALDKGWGPRITSFARIAPLMAAPLSLALIYDLFTMPSQVRAANARLGSESFGTASAGSTFQGARREASYGADREEQLAAKKADEIVARYIARQAQAAAPARATPTRSAPAGAPTFGRRVR